MYRRIVTVILVVSAMVVLAIVVLPRRGNAPTQTTNTVTTNAQTNTTTNAASVVGVVFSTNDEPDSLAKFRFTTRLPKAWVSQYDDANSMLMFSPLSAGQSDSGDTMVAITRVTGSSWPSGSGTVTSRTSNGHAVKVWNGGTVTAAWHERFDGWHRGETMLQAAVQVTSGKNGVYYQLTGGPGVSIPDWNMILEHIELTS